MSITLVFLLLLIATFYSATFATKRLEDFKVDLLYKLIEKEYENDENLVKKLENLVIEKDHFEHASPVKPVFKDHYHASGYIRLPYAELNEPFEIYYQGANKRSRIDFYHGMDRSFFYGDEQDYGITYKISPAMLDGIKTVTECFKQPGEEEKPVLAQSMLPDLTGFTFLSTGMRNGMNVNLWQNKSTMTFDNITVTNTYTFAVTKDTPPRPVQYLMMGYNTMFGTHYDKYIIDYDFYDEESELSDETFTIPKDLTCQEFPEEGVESGIKSNPVREMVNPEKGDRYHQLFGEFKKRYGKVYETDAEHEQRRGHFTMNVRMIHSMNRANLGYALDINHLADQSHEELKRRTGRLRQNGSSNGLPYDGHEMNDADVPKSWNWFDIGAVSPVKDQGTCGSCWSFGATQTIEGAVFVKHGKRVRLSTQMLMDCTWSMGNNGCDAGEETRAYEWLMKHGGIPLEETYGPYLGQNGICHYDKSMAEATVANYYQVTSGDQNALRKALVQKGPIAVGFDATKPSFRFYSHGTYYEPKCYIANDDLDHVMLLVGYGVDAQGQDYWLIKNSWSTYWGNNGYITVSTKNNNCGVATAATFVDLE